jgi:rubrerythrin
MATKPTFISSLNAIANGERGGHQLFRSWSDATKDKTLKKTLDIVAVREMEHSWAFEKRLNELGFDLQPAESSAALKKLQRMMKSKSNDVEKFAAFGIGAKPAAGAGDDQPDGLLQLLADKSIDPQTGELIGRFICEERDSGKLLTGAYQAMQRRRKRKPKAA